jgi:hypothetical protein
MYWRELGLEGTQNSELGLERTRVGTIDFLANRKRKKRYKHEQQRTFGYCWLF